MSIAFTLAFCACVDDIQPNYEEEIIPEGMEQISFMLPDYDDNAAQFGSRAFDPSTEGYMSNLYIIAIRYYDVDATEEFMKINAPQKQVFTFSLNPVGVKFNVGDEKYKIFNVTLYPGKYKFAVAANLDLYLTRQKSISDFTSEEDLKNIVLNFSEDTPLAPLHLPMVCLPENIKYKVKTTKNNTISYGETKSLQKTYYLKEEGGTELGEDGYFVDIKKEVEETDGSKKSNVICADMKFVCSKVRYTILFDKEEGGISSAFGSSWIRFNVDDMLKPTATNIRNQTKLVIESDASLSETDPFLLNNKGDIGSWDMSIDRFYWSDDDHMCKLHNMPEGENYPFSPKCELVPWDESTENWIPQKRKVWQGIVYLPENNGGKYIATETIENENGETNLTNIDKEIPSTILRFPYHVRANDNDDTPEVEADFPKEIPLFSNINKKYEGLGYDGNYSSSEGTFTGLDREYFYDVVALVKNPDVDEMDIKVFVSILPWHEIDQNISNEDDLHNEGNNSNSSSAAATSDVNSWNYNDYSNKW